MEDRSRPRAPEGGRRASFGLAAFGLAALLGSAACAAILGIDDRVLDDLGAEAGPDGVVSPPPAPGGGCSAGEECLPVPEGWTLVALSSAAEACAAGFGDATEVSVAQDGDGCKCVCTVTTPGRCAGGSVAMREYPSSVCTGSVANRSFSVTDGGCGTTTATTTSGTPYGRLLPPAPVAPSCDASAAPTEVVRRRACVARGSACTGGSCQIRPASPTDVCVVRDGDLPCPAAYPVKLPAGASVTDTRKCGPCTCTPETTCKDAELQLFGDAQCATKRAALPGSGACTALDAGTTFGSYRYVGTPPGCVPSAAPLDAGSLTFEAPRTLCCATGGDDAGS